VMRERVPAVARRLGLSERGLRDLFAAGVGVSPKRFAGLRRVRALMAADGPLADRASALGYYDQSHMAAEFRAVMGVPPGAFLAGVRPEPEYC
ncbi:MAG: helix-turn-helix domain-containing protein, partial [Nonomuraea sp.]|nr:helix-turn-helix domain-containing protein [Nonomuraea sp.]